ncbi:MAG: trypsin-like serine protease [Anaerolineales bacterium]|nr:MAG: trypsin-like serine protease [Anaerolineales bacterium]
MTALLGCSLISLPNVRQQEPTPTLPPTPTPIVIVVTATPLPPEMIEAVDVEEQRVIAVYQRASPAVVNITTQVLRHSFFFGLIPEEGSGSGFVYDRDGHIITNYHVVASTNEIMVSFGRDKELPAEIVGVDPLNDLAVLRVAELPEGVEPIPLGDSDALQVGQRAIAIGNPFGQFERTLTVGVVSAVNRTVKTDEDQVLRGVIQTDAAINRGNSGGPLLDSSGRLIGVNSALFSPTGTSAGVGLAIPVNKLKQIVPELIQNGRYPHPWLGIEGLGYDLYPELARALGLPVDRGLLIAQLYRNSPAVRAGLRGATEEVIYRRRRLLVGGDILTAIDGVPLHNWDDLDAYLQEQTEVGQTVTLTIWRDDQEMTIEVKLGEMPEGL